MPVKTATAPGSELRGAPRVSGAALTDACGRPLQDVRVSVTDRCNFRCGYCMPSGVAYPFLPSRDYLTFDELERLGAVFVSLGVSKIRVTGGEPLLRPGLDGLIGRFARLGIQDLALTTNGVLLSRQAEGLKAAGLRRVTVSLDALDDAVFRRVSGTKDTVAPVLDGIEAARRAGFEEIKVNAVIQRGVNDHIVTELAQRFRFTGIVLRFIEYMDVGTCNRWQAAAVVASADILARIHQRFPLEPVEANYFGEVASRYRYVDGGGEIGFVSSITQPFCGTCTRLRLSPEGKLYTCLFAATGTDIRIALKDGASDEDLQAIIRRVWQGREDRYSENRSLFRSLDEQRRKIEMYQIGG